MANKDDMQIMVVKTSTLFENKYFEGFTPKEDHNYEDIILNNFFFMRRGDAEVDPEHKQPIGYAVIFNPETKQVFAYQRGHKDEHYNESRLQGKVSFGVGGHIEKHDEDTDNPLHSSMLREIEEEVHLDHHEEIKALGFINDDSTEVGKVHFGVLYLIKTKAINVRPKDNEMANGKLRDIQELKSLLSDPSVEVENWSKIALEAIEKEM